MSDEVRTDAVFAVKGVDREVLAAFREQAVKEKRTQAGLFEAVFMTYLRRVGAWPRTQG